MLVQLIALNISSMLLYLFNYDLTIEFKFSNPLVATIAGISLSVTLQQRQSFHWNRNIGCFEQEFIPVFLFCLSTSSSHCVKQVLCYSTGFLVPFTQFLQIILTIVVTAVNWLKSRKQVRIRFSWFSKVLVHSICFITRALVTYASRHVTKARYLFHDHFMLISVLFVHSICLFSLLVMKTIVASGTYKCEFEHRQHIQYEMEIRDKRRNEQSKATKFGHSLNSSKFFYL
ncbi:Hypothetical_protein [Hexamita inflata]|uniref:Hypothetical_protein n=1 Tax=Hexamita inflata TaxID=28002 RepID=A0AA86TGV1_9EUKA|nr:Hypothetical protein HINF_LOCUS5819 [Hexamita inflata]